MPNLFRRWLHRFIPSHFHDPIGLARRLIRTGDPAALFAMQEALLGLTAAPLDMALQVAEQRRYRNAPPPRLPLLFICGAARTGTTLVEQVLIDQLPFAFINNLTAVFPRAPLTANRLFRPQTPRGGAPFHNYYGKTVGFSGPNDGLHLWDRWLGSDRTRIRSSLTQEEQLAMRSFFGAMEQLFGRPIIAKNNSLSASAHLVAEVFDQAFFICMTRDPLYLAQSQLKARLDIHGREDIPYGLSQPAGNASASTDVLEDICRQVLFHEQIVREQQRRIGAERFWVLQYETFCQDPSALVDEVAARILGQPRPVGAPRLPPFTASTGLRIESERFHQIAETLKRLGQGSRQR
jgi:Sulfotransferase family